MTIYNEYVMENILDDEMVKIWNEYTVINNNPKNNVNGKFDELIKELNSKQITNNKFINDYLLIYFIPDITNVIIEYSKLEKYEEKKNKEIFRGEFIYEYLYGYKTFGILNDQIVHLMRVDRPMSSYCFLKLTTYDNNIKCGFEINWHYSGDIFYMKYTGNEEGMYKNNIKCGTWKNTDTNEQISFVNMG